MFKNQNVGKYYLFIMSNCKSLNWKEINNDIDMKVVIDIYSVIFIFHKTVITT